jgi:hypothetical protein
MKHVVSVSLGSSSRNFSIETDFPGEKIFVERIGTDGDFNKAISVLKRIDGKVDAISLGGADFGIEANKKYYPIHSVKFLKESIKNTPFTDGLGVKYALESNIESFLEESIPDWLNKNENKVLLVNAVSRWGMAESFINAGFNCIYGDFMFSLGLNIPVYSRKIILAATRLFCPFVTRLPFSYLYPVGQNEEKHIDKFEKYYFDVSVIAGDCLYIMQSLPENIEGKTIVTNTTTESDREKFFKAGVENIVTTTPVINGRSFGTNVIEAIIIASSGKKRILSHEELNNQIKLLRIRPQLIKK